MVRQTNGGRDVKPAPVDLYLHIRRTPPDGRLRWLRPPQGPQDQPGAQDAPDRRKAAADQGQPRQIGHKQPEVSPLLTLTFPYPVGDNPMSLPLIDPGY
jgi:hypothetical protein